MAVNPFEQMLMGQVQQNQQLSSPQQSQFSGANDYQNKIDESFSNMFKMLKSSKNQDQAISMLARVNPQFREIVNMCEGRNPKDVFMQECQAKGINPQQALQTLSRLGMF